MEYQESQVKCSLLCHDFQLRKYLVYIDLLVKTTWSRFSSSQWDTCGWCLYQNKGYICHKMHSLFDYPFLVGQ